MEKTINCYAKVNLSLDVLNKRDDGYHNLEMVMQEISLCDVLRVSADIGGCGIEVKCSNESVPQNADNIATKAAELFLSASGICASVKIHIEKHTPMGAGLGGGSSDAAGVLLALNSIFDFPLSMDKLAEIASKIGSDVPFFLYGGCMLAEGIGTVLSPVPPIKDVFILLAKPSFSVSTPHVYKSLSLSEKTRHPNTKEVLAALRDCDLKRLAQNTGNVLETVTSSEHPEIEEYKQIMLSSGAAYSLMSGSGPTVFGVFEDRQKVEAAAKILKTKTDEVFITTPI